LRDSRGFTLIEVLVVLMVLGLTVGLTTLGFQRLEDDRLEQQAGQLSTWLQSVSDNAVLDGALYGVGLNPDGSGLAASFFLNYRWWPMAGIEWQAPALEEDSELYMMAGKSWRLLTGGDSDSGRPEVQFFPTGVALPDQFQLRYDGRVAVIERDTDGLFTWSVQ
jgi:type II secretion system protein H